MASVNWKVSGVVQDSEEEDDALDSQELGPGLPQAVQSIWDVPDSPCHGSNQAGGGTHQDNQPRETSPQSSPLSSLPDVDELFDSQHTVPRTKTKRTSGIRYQPRLDRDASPDPLVARDQQLPARLVIQPRHTSPTDDEEGEDQEEERRHPAVPQLERSERPSITSELENHDPVVESAATSSTQWAASRSLRPRKPIQQNPYLIEGAQYSKVLKDHGLRPVRMHREELVSPRKSSRDETSQDHDFQDDSQNTTGGDSGAGWEGASITPRGSPDEQIPDSSLRHTLPPSSGTPTVSSKEFNTPGRRDTNPTSPLAMSDDEELPSIDDILRRPAKSVPRKRHASPSRHLMLKRRSRSKIFAPRSTEAQLEAHQTLQQLASPSPVRRIRDGGQGHKLRRFAVDIPQRVISVDDAAGLIDLTMEDAHDSIPPDQDSPSSTSIDDEEPGSASESGSDIVQYGQKARGVLPASHFRLDRATNQRRNNQKQLQRHADGVVDSTPKRGVAVRTTGNRSNHLDLDVMSDLDGDSSDSDALPSLQQASETTLVQSNLIVGDTGWSDDGHLMAVNEGDDSVGAADQHAGKQLPRQMTQEPSRGVQLRQPKITRHITRGSSTSIAKPDAGPSASRSRQRHAKAPRRKPSRAPVPRLGILDVIEPDAPNFLKIAARTATRKRGKGRSSPNKKTIFFATRADQVDAGTRLLNWKQGKIHPRKSLPTPPKPRRALSSVANTTPSFRSLSGPQHRTHRLGSTRTSGSPSSSRPLHKQSTIRGSSIDVAPKPRPHAPVFRQRRSQVAAPARPAQLEDEAVGPGPSVRLTFDKHKRALDTLYRRSNRLSAAPSIVSDHTITEAPHTILSPDGSISPGVGKSPTPRAHRASRLKKATKPHRVDTTSAQYVHAHDPLPATRPNTTETARVDERSDGILVGLGPFGTHYSHHFEVFPLQNGIYFHEDTLLGNGCIDASTDASVVDRICHDRPKIIYNINGRFLKWGVWTDAVSSELGQLVDVIWHDLARIEPANEPRLEARAAVQFIWRYIQNAFSVSEDSQVCCFAARIHEVMNDLLDRLDNEPVRNDLRQQMEVIEVLSHCLMVIVSTLTICQHPGAAFSDQSRIESLLVRLSKICVSKLLQVGLQEVTKLYDNCQRLSFRERGIRHDDIPVQAWVLLMRSLAQLRIPRQGFWDILASVLVQPQHRVCSDAIVFEEIWKTVFVLLPLCEFDNSGVVMPGARHELATDGWAVPQLILKRTFDIYKSNNRQHPGFNSYCRALIGRCHYLVDQWGWLKSGGVIGIIFDFFASLNLSHLRNEGGRQSPAFLESLHLSPSLKVEQGDVCFHIFLKLVAVTIRRLADRNLVKDVKNLVFRVLPNHNRQYLKEQDVHQQELAALRNHHDLFCTLFWAAPPDQRPQLSHLEGLVIPVSSHKEACLISLRAWSQLARFLVSKDDAQSFHPFFRWQARTFQQLLQQYGSIDQDIQQQLQDLSKKPGAGVSEDLTRAITASNKAATMEVLQASVALSLDVAKHARSLELALLSGNYLQLEQIYEHFADPVADSPWSIYRDATAIIDALLDRIELLLPLNGCHTSGRASLDNSIMLVDDNLSVGYFRLARRMARKDGELLRPNHSTTTAAKVVESTVTVAGKLTATLLRCGATRLSQCFKPGRHCLFDGLPMHLNLHQRQYLPLFLAEILKRGALDLSDVSITPLQLWLECLVKPRKYLHFEDRFAIALRRRGAPFVPDSVRQSSVLSRYETNRSHLEYTLSWMRQESHVGSSQEKKTFVSQCASSLMAAMKQIELDLAANVDDEDEHHTYVAFVRRVISLIKSYGAGICAVPSYFYQVSREYSPPELDPQLLVAQVQSYGIRLDEGDSRAVPQLFSFLYHNFKQAVLHSRLSKEVLMLQRGMKQEAILTFSLGTMMPAIIQATLARLEAFVIYDTFCEALHLRLARSSAPGAMQGQGIRSIIHLVWAMTNWAAVTRSAAVHRLQPEQVHLFRKMIFLLNSLQPVLESLSFLEDMRDSWADLEGGLGRVDGLVEKAIQYLQRHYIPGSGVVDGNGLLAGSAGDGSHEIPRVGSLADELVQDIRKTWQQSGGTITIQAPFRSISSTQSPSGQGIPKPIWDVDDLVQSLGEQLNLWSAWWIRCRKSKRTEGEAEASE